MFTMITYQEIDREPVYLYILSLLPIRKLGIFERFRKIAGSFEKIFFASEKELTEYGFGLELIIKLRRIKAENSVEKIIQDLQKTRVNTLTYYEPLYPGLLKEIFDAPPVLFYRGILSDPKESCVAIVGSRAMTPYGASILPRITTPLIHAGVTIISGLALGIDGAAHSESVKKEVRTIAVLGCGVDAASVYPRGHYQLSEQILDTGGLLISEQPPKMPALKHHFIARNRIIAGMSLGVVIVECKLKSGALITADYAADFNRTLYAVPGPAYSKLSEGPHKLIRDGAALITTGEEILDDLSLALPSTFVHKNQFTKESFTENEKLMLKFMHSKPISPSEISHLTGLSPSVIMQSLTILELRGVIKNVGVEGFIYFTPK